MQCSLTGDAMGARATGALLGLCLLGYAIAHVSIVGSLFWRGLWGKGAICVVLPPLAPFWGWKLGMRRRATTWVVALAAYAVGLIVLAGPWS